jgi:hypothetical protein
VARFRAYEAYLAGHTLGETFIRAAAFLNLAAANARATSVDLNAAVDCPAETTA